MNINYINAVTADLIQYNDFLPVKGINGEYILFDDLKILQKASIEEFHVIFIINGDSMNDYQLKQTFENNMTCINGINITGISDHLLITEVLVFENKPDVTKLNVIEERIAKFAENNFTNEILIAELNQKNLFDYSESYPSSNELKILLSNPFFKNLETYSTLPDISELINRNPNDYKPLEMETDKAPATYVLVGINVAIWLLGQLFLFFFKEDFLSTLGIKDNNAILAGEYWRLITPVFLHSDNDVMHIFANSFSLIMFGQFVERTFGIKKFLIIYFISGFLGNLGSFIFSSHLSLGASGAIMGIGGAFIHIWLKNRETFSGSSRQYLTFVFLVFFNLFYGFTRPGIDNFAHFGGFIGGFLTAGALYKNQKDKLSLYLGALFVIIIVGIIIGFNT